MTLNRSINNGSRELVAFGNFTGSAGVVEKDGVTRVAIAEDARRLGEPKAGAIAGRAYTVLRIDKSDPAKGGIKGMVVLTVTPAG